MICDRCRKDKPDVERRLMNTRYVDEDSNYCTQCEDCFKETELEWALMWEDYYSGL